MVIVGCSAVPSLDMLAVSPQRPNGHWKASMQRRWGERKMGQQTFCMRLGLSLYSTQKFWQSGSDALSMNENRSAVPPCTGHGLVRKDSWKLSVEERVEIESF